MPHHGDAFEAYRYSPPAPVTLPKLLLGLLIIVICWFAVTLVVLLPVVWMTGGNIDMIFQDRIGILSMLVSFAGIWIGVWAAQRFVFREPLRRLLGVGETLAWPDFWKGCGAVVITSILSEILLYIVNPEMARTSIDLRTWLTMLVPLALLTFVQTSAEEVLFRGYLLRGLANRFRSAWIWALLPGLAFVSLHMSPSISLNDFLLVLASIGSLTAALTLVVYLTGNLGAGFGMHFANNFFAFALIAHQDGMGAFSLYRGGSIENLESGALTIAVVSLVCVALTVLLLVHRASPLCVRRG